MEIISVKAAPVKLIGEPGGMETTPLIPVKFFYGTRTCIEMKDQLENLTNSQNEGNSNRMMTVTANAVK